MKTYLYYSFILALFITGSLQAQIETNTNSIQFEINDIDTPQETGLELPARTKPSLTIPMKDRFPNGGMPLEEEQQLEMGKSDGLKENIYDKAPKAFTKDKEVTDKYDRDQFLGDIKTGSTYVNIKYRDHEYVDGDLIRVFVNGDIVQSQVYLNGSFSGFTLRLEEGINTIEFQALNQGSSGPNTAELHVYDEKGFIISAKEWNLLTGRKATIVVNKN